NTQIQGEAFYNQTHGRADIKLFLPQDWDEALKLAAEVEEEIPEYVECITDQRSFYGNFGELGKIYKVKCWNFNETDCLLEGTTSGSTDRSRFKPSTKEAYEEQKLIIN